MYFYVINKIKWHEINMVAVFLCIYCTKIVHDNKLFPACKRLAFDVQLMVYVINISGNGGDFCSIVFIYQTKFDAKVTKSKWNYTANMIINVSGTVSNQSDMASSQSKQLTCILILSADQCGFLSCWHLEPLQSTQ